MIGKYFKLEEVFINGDEPMISLTVRDKEFSVYLKPSCIEHLTENIVFVESLDLEYGLYPGFSISMDGHPTIRRITHFSQIHVGEPQGIKFMVLAPSDIDNKLQIASGSFLETNSLRKKIERSCISCRVRWSNINEVEKYHLARTHYMVPGTEMIIRIRHVNPGEESNVFSYGKTEYLLKMLGDKLNNEMFKLRRCISGNSKKIETLTQINQMSQEQKDELLDLINFNEELQSREIKIAEDEIEVLNKLARLELYRPPTEKTSDLLEGISQDGRYISVTLSNPEFINPEIAAEKVKIGLNGAARDIIEALKDPKWNKDDFLDIEIYGYGINGNPSGSTCIKSYIHKESLDLINSLS